MLENLISRLITKLSEGLMHPLWTMIRNLINICVGLEQSPGLAIKDGTLRVRKVDDTCLSIDRRLFCDLWVWLLLLLEHPVVRRVRI